MAVFLFMSAISSAIGEAFVCMSTPSCNPEFTETQYFFLAALSADPLLVWNYGAVGILSFFSGVGFWYSVRNLDRREDELNNLPEGHLVLEK